MHEELKVATYVDAAGHRVNSGKRLDSYNVYVCTILHHVLPIMNIL